MNYSLKPTQMQIVEFIAANGQATPRQICTLLGCDSREANDRLNGLRRSGIVKNVGKYRQPEYRLLQNWRSKVKPAKGPRQPAEQKTIAEVCREQWQGYAIHRIFGSARP